MRGLIFLALSLCGCVAHIDERYVWSVNEVDARGSELDGKVIKVAGWLPRCGGRDCTLYNSKLDADTFRQAPEGKRLLSIAHDPQFDASIRPMLPAHIVLEAQVNAECLEPRVRKNPDGSQYIIICADRTDDLKPIKLIEVQSAGSRALPDS